MKIDGRTLYHKTSQTIRIMAVRRVKEGNAPSAVMKSYSLCRTSCKKRHSLMMGIKEGFIAFFGDSMRVKGRHHKDAAPCYTPLSRRSGRLPALPYPSR